MEGGAGADWGFYGVQKRCCTVMRTWNRRVRSWNGTAREEGANRALAVPITRIVCDEEQLPFEDHSQDAIMSCLALHWVNDLPGQSYSYGRSVS